MKGFLKYRKEMLEREKQITGRDLSNRMTGRTLSIALNLISKSLASPGKEFEIIDQYPHTRLMNDLLFKEIRNRIDDMNLEGFTFNKAGKNVTMKFSLEYKEDEKTTTD